VIVVSSLIAHETTTGGVISSGLNGGGMTEGIQEITLTEILHTIRNTARLCVTYNFIKTSCYFLPV